MASCRFKGCTKDSVNFFCELHLKGNSIDLLQFSEHIKVNPSCFVSNKKDDTNLINVFATMSALKMKRSKRKAKKISVSIKKSIEHNRSRMDVIRLSKCQEARTGCFFAPNATVAESMQTVDKINIWEDSSKFKEYESNNDRHQLFVDENTNEIVFFLPSLEWQRKVFADKVNLIKTCISRNFNDKLHFQLSYIG